MKSIRFSAAVLSMSMLLAGCSSASAPSETADAKFSKEGTYTATVQGHNGEIVVTADFSKDRIESITIDSSETESIGVLAMEELKNTILEEQSIGVDTKSGATISSEAFLSAMKDLITQAGGDPESMSTAVSDAKNAEDVVTSADVVIVGAGGAGLTAALTAAENGATVLLLEKSGFVGGNTLCAFNGINAAGSDVQAEMGSTATVEEFKEVQMNNEEAREELVDALVEHSGETIDWLAGLGVQFEQAESHGEPKLGDDLLLMAPADGSTTQTLVNAVYAKIKENNNITLLLNTDVTDLIVTDGVVTGVKAISSEGKEQEYTGKAVLLATGGFGQNNALVTEVNPDLANTITDEIAPTTGEGLEMALAIGAKAVDLGAIQTFPHVVSGFGMITPMNLPGGFTPAAIYVNDEAKRFVSEGFGVNEDVLAQPEGHAYCIFTEEGMNDTMKTLLSTGYAVEAESVQELAEKLGLDEAALQETVDVWNQDVDAGVDSLFGRTENMVKLEGTLYGYPFGVGAHYFMGGLLINPNAQVLDENEEPIPGLYAAGEVTGGVQGTYRVDGSGVGDAFIFGRIAGQSIVEAIK